MSNEPINQNVNQQPNNDTPADNGGQGGKMFTQEDVNRIVSERLAREREKLAQQPQEDEREKALREREQALAARETKVKCQDYLAEINFSEKYRQDFLEALDTSDFDKFKAVVDRLGKPFIVKTVTVGANVPHPPANNVGSSDAKIAAAFKPKI